MKSSHAPCCVQVSLGNSLPASKPVPRILLPELGAGLIPIQAVASIQDGQKREKVGVTEALPSRGASGLAALLQAVQPLGTNPAQIPGRMSAPNLREGEGRREDLRAPAEDASG